MSSGGGIDFTGFDFRPAEDGLPSPQQSSRRTVLDFDQLDMDFQLSLRLVPFDPETNRYPPFGQDQTDL
jgi:hypothetical protein